MAKRPFFDQNHGLTPLKKSQFFEFLNFLFLQLRKAFFRFPVSLSTFFSPILPKKKLEKWRVLTKTLWKNFNASTFSTSCFYSLERRFFVLEYPKRQFPGLYCLKKKVAKMAIFTPKAWVNPFGKNSIFRLFQLLVFIAQKGVFLFYNIVKDVFLDYTA